MNVKQTVKKMSAVLTGAAMVGATVMGALAYDLSDYPYPFVEDGVYNAKIVVGANAMPQDILGAIDIAGSLQAASKTPVSSVGGTVTVAGGKAEEASIGDALNAAGVFGSSLDDNDLAALKEGTVTIDIGGEDEDYDFHEEVVFTSGATVDTGLTAANPHEDFGTDTYLLMAADSVGYRFVFDDALNTDNYIVNATDDDPIILDFLGRTMEITGATDDSITVQVGEKLFLEHGDEVEVDGHELSLVRVGNDNVIVSVDGDQDDVDEGQTRTIGGLRVKLETAYNDDGTENDAATLIVGEEATKTYNDGDEYIGEDEDDPDWVWKLDLNRNDPVLGIDWDRVLDDPDDEGLITVGESFSLPGDYVTISLDSYNQDEYKKYTISQETGTELYDASGNDYVTSAKVLLFEGDGSDEDSFIVGSETTDEVAVWYNDTSDNYELFFKDHNDANKFKLDSTFGNATSNAALFQIDFKDSTIDVGFAGAADGTASWTINETGDDLVLYTELLSGEFDYLGHGDGDTVTANDLKYGPLDISGWEEDTRTSSGLIVHAYDSSASSDEFSFEVPREYSDFKVNVVVSGEASIVEREDTGAYEVNELGVGVAVLDTDAEDLLGETPLIVVGGPYVNTIAMQLMGNPTGEQVEQMFEAGKAKIKLYEDQNAVLVAGYNAQDTVGAAYVLADYNNPDYDLTGSEVEVIVPSLNNIDVMEPSLPSSVDDLTEETVPEETGDAE